VWVNEKKLIQLGSRKKNRKRERTTSSLPKQKKKILVKSRGKGGEELHFVGGETAKTILNGQHWGVF